MDNLMKCIFGTIALVATYFANAFNELVVVLIAFMAMDYVTGVMAAFIKKELSSRAGLIGVLKKFAYVILILMSYSLDFVLTYISAKLGFKISTNGAFGAIATIWLIATEALSVIENLHAMKIRIPNFITQAFEKLKSQVEQTPEEGK